MRFWAVAAGLTALAVGLLLPPLLRRPTRGWPRAAYDLTVYRDQLAEIERDLARGTLSADQAAAARTEIERRLLAAAAGREGPAAADPADETSGSGAPADPRRRAGRWLAVALTIGLPAAAFALYAILGAPGVPSLPFAERPAPERTAAEARHDEVARLAAQLAARMAERPDDPRGWLLLARTYRTIDRHAEAAEAFGEAIARGLDQAEVHAARGEMLVAADNGSVGPEARRAFAAALEQDPANPRARYYAGLALAQDGHLRVALDLWVALAREAPADAAWRPVVERQIQEAAARLGLDPSELPQAADTPRNAEAPGTGAPPGPSAADIEAAARMSPEARAALIRAMVERLAARLEAQPEDFDGWLRLARAYSVLGEPAAAERALDRAARLVRDLPDGAPERGALNRARKAVAPAP
ncbi:MAG: c-type cytochrome biogenesis protein CcmI [Kiloniellaceae bacterium]